MILSLMAMVPLIGSTPPPAPSTLIAPVNPIDLLSGFHETELGMLQAIVDALASIHEKNQVLDAEATIDRNLAKLSVFNQRRIDYEATLSSHVKTMCHMMTHPLYMSVYYAIDDQLSRLTDESIINKRSPLASKLEKLLPPLSSQDERNALVAALKGLMDQEKLAKLDLLKSLQAIHDHDSAQAAAPRVIELINMLNTISGEFSSLDAASLSSEDIKSLQAPQKEDWSELQSKLASEAKRLREAHYFNAGGLRDVLIRL